MTSPIMADTEDSPARQQQALAHCGLRIASSAIGSAAVLPSAINVGCAPGPLGGPFGPMLLEAACIAAMTWASCSFSIALRSLSPIRVDKPSGQSDGRLSSTTTGIIQSSLLIAPVRLM